MEEVKESKEIKEVEEVNKVEREPMSQEEFEEYLKKPSLLRLTHFAGVNKFKSVNRAIKRGHLSQEGIIFPKRPFNNRANTSERKDVHSRTFNELKKSIYARLTKSKEGTA